MFLMSGGFTHGELLEMALEDYGLDKKIEKVVLTYSLPDVILQQMAPDTPPMHVTNDRQVRNLIELAKTHFICVATVDCFVCLRLRGDLRCSLFVNAREMAQIPVVYGE
ncbi:hypothetical protein F2Q69_00043547 [Brassica cretica]|nr:hypothetical protein F2Q69_00043547 [Brassica cretica]